MKRSVVHKENLPAQVCIKRRRTAVAVASASSSLASFPAISPPSTIATNANATTTTTTGTTTAAAAAAASSLDRGNGDGDVHCTDAESVVLKSSGTSEGGSLMEESNDEEDDMEELEEERRRIEQLRLEKQRLRDTKSGENVTRLPDAQPTGMEKNAGSAVGGISSYNHDVLFRRREWREEGIVASRDETKKKWGALQNNAQKSAAFQHFMKKHFK